MPGATQIGENEITIGIKELGKLHSNLFETFTELDTSFHQRHLPMPVCQAKKATGRPCAAKAQHGSHFCFFHDPETIATRRQAQSRGGRKRSPLVVVWPPPEEFSLSDPTGITSFLTYVANRVVRGQLDAKVANASAYIADCALRALNVAAVTERLGDLERLQRAEENRPFDLADYSTSHFQDEEALEDQTQTQDKSAAS